MGRASVVDGAAGRLQGARAKAGHADQLLMMLQVEEASYTRGPCLRSRGTIRWLRTVTEDAAVFEVGALFGLADPARPPGRP